MDKHNNTAPSEQSVPASMQPPNKSVSHFNWFARFETQQTPYPIVVEITGK